MLVIETIVHETIWGGKKLTPYSGTNNKKIGHLYSLISNGELESKILNGEYRGQLFRKYFDENKARFGLSNYKEFPFLLALVDASDDLSLQVHPNDVMAKELEGADFGKNESWYFIDAPKTGKIFDGCKARTSQELKEKVTLGKYDDVIDFLEVRSGDYVYIEAGTMHAMSAGSLVYEIEENCNATYRVYDFDRVDKDGKKRPLQTENALKSIDVSLKSKTIPYVGEKTERLYSTQLFKNTEEYTNVSNTLECLTVIDGESEVEGQKVQRGVTIVLEPNETVKLNKSEFVISRPLLKEAV
ncbi:MAG TPA: class I mannose-6-phosphate isomerase [Candidatus Caccosoma faecigallinarum]|uniref:Class I mannose-6-phosphate isomerase n=1 Tax=Candidatus Caccosoma faecigallinarum TaxID=2840720 RepID=A0A9D1G8N7_9FIRM|nr:class I mannose-6-phosphate isomerase [Candidatus Caccosoma faecigallinarum]